MKTSVTRAILLLAVLAANGLCQSLSWIQFQSAGSAPAPREDGTIAYDSTGRVVYLFGGQDSVTRNDLWAWSLDRREWTQVAVNSPSVPPARFYHAMTFDSLRRRLIVFGGIAGSNQNDTWAFDIASGAWTQIGQFGRPKARHGTSAIYDSKRDRVVISHGFGDSGRLNDTWALDLKTQTWTELTPSGTKPLNRCLHRAVFDAAGDQMYLYAGCSSGYGPCPQGDLWSLNLATNQWTSRTQGSAPPPRSLYGMAFDDERSRLVVFGGSGSTLNLDDTWEFNPAAGSWQQLTFPGSAPTARQRLESAWVPGLGLVVFGGLSDNGLSNELWALTTAPTAPSIDNGGVIDAFSGIGSTAAPGEVVSIYGAGLGPADGAAQSFDTRSLTLPNSASGVSVTWNGIASPLYYVSARQVNAQVPYELAGAKDASVVVTVNGQPTAATKISIAPVHPAVFPRVYNKDLSINSPANPAHAGDLIFFFATGQGVTSPASKTGAAAIGAYPEPAAAVSVTIGGTAVSEIPFRGQAPYTTGVMQVNARIAPLTPTGDAVPLVLSVAGVSAQTGVTVAIRP